MRPAETFNFIVLLGCLVYLASLVLPVFYTEEVISRREGLVRDGHTWYGWQVLVFGWLAIISSKYWSMAWFANQFFVLGVVAYRMQSRWSVPVLIAGIFIARTAFSFHGMFSDKEPPATEVIGFGLGLYSWIAAFYIVLAGIVWEWVVSLMSSSNRDS